MCITADGMTVNQQGNLLKKNTHPVARIWVCFYKINPMMGSYRILLLLNTCFYFMNIFVKSWEIAKYGNPVLSSKIF